MSAPTQLGSQGQSMMKPMGGRGRGRPCTTASNSFHWWSVMRDERGHSCPAWVESGSSEKCLPGVMKTKEPENQVTLVTQTICLAKKCLDLIVDAFHAAVVDPVLPPCKNATLMAEKSSGHLPHLADARFVGPSAPLVEERPHLAIGGLFPKQAQGFLEQVASEQGLIVLERQIGGAHDR